MCWEKKTHLSKGLCGSEPYIAPELFDQKGQSRLKSFGISKHSFSNPKAGSISSSNYHSRVSLPLRGDSENSPTPPSKGRDSLHVSSILNRKSSLPLTSLEYDARLVDVWAAAIVFYCMQFQELPWRVAKPSDPTFATYRQTRWDQFDTCAIKQSCSQGM
jgi:serine/threonine protein kinase